MPHVELPTRKVFYTRSRGPADGPALVLLHGAGGSRLSWPAELRRLSGATVYTLDLPGHGRSEGPGRDSIAAYAEDVIAFLDAVETERAVPAGHSMGGAVALTLALDFDRVAGLVLVATGARLRVAPAILESIRSDFEAVVKAITAYAWSPEAPSAQVELGQRRLRQAGPDVLLDDLTACDRFDVVERLGEIATPTLVIGASADRLTPVKYARFLADHITAARLVIVDGAGHMVTLERSAEVAGAVRTFLETAGENP